MDISKSPVRPEFLVNIPSGISRDTSFLKVLRVLCLYRTQSSRIPVYHGSANAIVPCTSFWTLHAGKRKHASVAELSPENIGDLS